MVRRKIVPIRRATPESVPAKPSDAQVDNLRARLQGMLAEAPAPEVTAGTGIQVTPAAEPVRKVGEMGRHDLGRESDHVSDTGGGFYAPLNDETGPIAPTAPPELPEHVRWILAAIPTWSARFTEKAVDYGDAVNELGKRGQFADMHRKMGKLKRAMWNNEKLVGEQPIEICEDLIGHCFLTMYFLSNPDAEVRD